MERILVARHRAHDGLYLCQSGSSRVKLAFSARPIAAKPTKIETETA